jgi:hypothetical protein
MSRAAGVNELPDVGQIQGLLLTPAPTPKDAKVTLQYTDQKQAWHQTTMPFLDAMYLLNLLKVMQIESGFRMPENPFEKPMKK